MCEAYVLLIGGILTITLGSVGFLHDSLHSSCLNFNRMSHWPVVCYLSNGLTPHQSHFAVLQFQYPQFLGLSSCEDLPSCEGPACKKKH